MESDLKQINTKPVTTTIEEMLRKEERKREKDISKKRRITRVISKFKKAERENKRTAEEGGDTQGVKIQKYETKNERRSEMTRRSRRKRRGHVITA